MPRPLVALATTVAVSAAVVGWLVLRPAAPVPGHAGAGASPSATASTPSREQADAAAAAGALSELATDPDSLLAAAARAAVGTGARRAVPEGSVVTPDVSTWAPDGVGGGTLAVTVTPPRGPEVDYAAIMVQEGGEWKVLATVPLAGP